MDRFETLEENLEFTDKTFNDTQDLNAQLLSRPAAEQQIPSSRQMLGISDGLYIHANDPIYEEEESAVVDLRKIVKEYGYVTELIRDPHFAWTAATTRAVRHFCALFHFMKSRWMVIFGQLREDGGVCLSRGLCEKLLTTPMVDSDPATGLPVGIEALCAFLRYFRDMHLHCLLKNLPKLESENFWFYDPIFRSQLRHRNVQDREVYTHLIDEEHQTADDQEPLPRVSHGNLWQSAMSQARRFRRPTKLSHADHMLRQGFVGAQFLGFSTYEDFLAAVKKVSKKTVRRLYPNFWVKHFLREALHVFFPLINWEKMAFRHKGSKYVLQMVLLLLEYGLFHGCEAPELLEAMLRCSERLSQAEQQLVQTREQDPFAISDSEWFERGRESHACRLIMSKICLHLLALHLDMEVEDTYNRFKGLRNQTLRNVHMLFSMQAFYENKSFRADRTAAQHILPRLTRVYTCYLMRDTKLLDGFRETVNSRNRLSLEFYIKHFVMFIGHQKEDLFLSSLRSLMPESVAVYRQRAREAKRTSSRHQDPHLQTVQKVVVLLDEILKDLKKNFVVKLEDVDSDSRETDLIEWAGDMDKLLSRSMFGFNEAAGAFLQDMRDVLDFDQLLRARVYKDQTPPPQYEQLLRFLDQRRNLREQIECGMDMLLNKLFLAMNLLTRAVKTAEAIVEEKERRRIRDTANVREQCRKWMGEVRRGFAVALLVTRDNSQLANQFFSVANKKHLIFFLDDHKKELIFTILLLFDGTNCVTLLRKNPLVSHLLFTLLDFELRDFGLEVQSRGSQRQDLTTSRGLRQSKGPKTAPAGGVQESSRWFTLVFLTKLFKRLTQPNKFDSTSLSIDEKKGEKTNIFFDQKRGKIDVTTEMKLSNLLSGVLFGVWETFLAEPIRFSRKGSQRTASPDQPSKDFSYVPLVLRHLTGLLYHSVKNFFDPGFFDRALPFFHSERTQQALLNLSSLRENRDSQRALFNLLNVYDCFKSAAKTLFSLKTPPPKRGLESEASVQVRVEFDKCPKLLRLFLGPDGFPKISEYVDLDSMGARGSRGALTLVFDPQQTAPAQFRPDDDLRIEFLMEVAFPVVFKWLQKRKIDRNIFDAEQFSLIERFLASSFLRHFPSGLVWWARTGGLDPKVTTELLQIFSSTIQSELDVVFTEDQDAPILRINHGSRTGPSQDDLIPDAVRMMTKRALQKSEAQAQTENQDIRESAVECGVGSEGNTDSPSKLLTTEGVLDSTWDMRQRQLRSQTEKVLTLKIDHIENRMWGRFLNAVKSACDNAELNVRWELVGFFHKYRDQITREAERSLPALFERLDPQWKGRERQSRRELPQWLQNTSKEREEFFVQVLLYRNEQRPKEEQAPSDKVTREAITRVNQELDAMLLVVLASKRFTIARRQRSFAVPLRTARKRIYQYFLERRGDQRGFLEGLKQMNDEQEALFAEISEYEKAAWTLFQDALRLALDWRALNESAVAGQTATVSAAQLQRQQQMHSDNLDLQGKIARYCRKAEEHNASYGALSKQASDLLKAENKASFILDTHLGVRAEIWRQLQAEPPLALPGISPERVKGLTKEPRVMDQEKDNLIKDIRNCLRDNTELLGVLETERKKLFQRARREEGEEGKGRVALGRRDEREKQEESQSLVRGFAPVIRAIASLQLAQKYGQREVLLCSHLQDLVLLVEKTELLKEKGQPHDRQALCDLKQVRQQRSMALAISELIAVKRIDHCLKMVIDFYAMSPMHLRFLTVNRILDQNDMAVCHRILSKERLSLASQLDADSDEARVKLYEDSHAKCYAKKHKFRSGHGLEVIAVDGRGRPTRSLSFYERWADGKWLRMAYILQYKDFKAWICEEGGDAQVFNEIVNFKGEIAQSSRHLTDYMFKLTATMRPDVPKPQNIFTHYESFYCLNKPFYSVLQLLGRLMALPVEAGEKSVKELICERLESDPEAAVFFFNLWRLFTAFQGFMRRKNFQVKDYFAIYRPFFIIIDFFKNLCEDNFRPFKAFFNERSEADLFAQLPDDLRERYWRQYRPSKARLAQIVYRNLVHTIGRSDLPNATKTEVDIFDRPSHFYLVNDLVYMLTEFVNGGLYRPEWVLIPRYQSSVWADILYRMVDDPNDYFYVIKHKVLVFMMALVESEKQSFIDFMKAQLSCDMLVDTMIRMIAKLYIYCRKKQRTRQAVTEHEFIFAEGSQAKRLVSLDKDDLRDEDALLGNQDRDGSQSRGNPPEVESLDTLLGQQRTPARTPPSKGRPPLQMDPLSFLKELLEFYYTCEEDFSAHQLMETAVLMLTLLYQLADRLPEFSQKIERYDSLVPENLKLEMRKSMRLEYVLALVKSWFSRPTHLPNSREGIYDNEIVAWFFLTQIIDKVEIVEVKADEPAEDGEAAGEGTEGAPAEGGTSSRIVVHRFRKLPEMFFYSDELKYEFVQSADVDSRESKLKSFYDDIEDKVLLLRSQLARYKSFLLLYHACKPEVAYVAIWVLFLLALAINVLMLLFYNKNSNDFDSYSRQDETRTVTALTAVSLAIAGTFLLLWGIYTASFFNLKLLKEKNESKFMSRFWFHLRLVGHVLYALPQSLIGMPLLLVIICYILGLCGHYFWLTLPLFLILPLSELLNSIIIAIFRNGLKLLYLLLIIFAVASNLAMLAIQYFKDSFHTENLYEQDDAKVCATFRQCVLDIFNLGMRLSAGISDQMVFTGQLTDHNYFAIYFFNIIGYTLIVLMLLGAFFGLVVDTFKNYKAQLIQHETSDNSVCFICDMKAADFSRYNLNFRAHTDQDHNTFGYFGLYLFLVSKPEIDYSGKEIYIHSMMKGENRNDVLPNRTCRTFQLRGLKVEEGGDGGD